MTPMMTAITHLNVMTMRCVFLNGDLVRRNIVVDRRKEEDHQRQKVIAVINLLLRFQADVDAQSEDGKTALHYATSDDAFDVANILLDANATLDIPEETGKTALHLCIQEGGLLVTNLLLSRGANIDVEDFAGRTPLTLMLQRSNVNVLQILLNHHHLVATPHRHDFAGELLMQAVDLQAEAVVRFIVENKYTSSTVKNAAGETPLHRAILKHSPAFMEVLADLDPTGNILIDVTLTSETPAHYAARYGSVLEVETLLNCMASAFGELEFLNPTNPVNAVDQNGVTPLYLAGTIACGSNNNADQSRIGTEAAAGIMESRHGKVQLFLQHGARLFPPGVLVNELSPRDADLTTNGPRLTLPIQVQTCLKIWLTENTAHIGEPEDDETALQISNDTSFEALTTLCAHWVATVACVGYWASCLPIIIGAGYSHEIVPLLVGLPLCRSSFSILLSQLETHPQQTQELERYLQATFAIDVKSPDFTGRDVFVKQLKLFAECHTSFECTATSMNVFSRIGHPDVEEETAGHDDSNKNVYVVQTYGTTTLQISRTTIEQIFPHILTDEPLVQSLIGKKYSLPFTMFTYVDVNNGCVFQVETKVDLTSALLDLLQDPVATIKMVQETAMTKHGNLLLTDDVQEDQNDVGNCLF
ncbi:hypothetical protein PHYBOEH_006976 [Phytophthora boehmeriae]|uniref:Uncharacterized protein n=1 Tax=Phytophthora boehmeriae TaxID=109152 RepID=A0A8T1WEB0_9STRA|nr:hypothetical protein PHYBOEH_006976 [Phytophthora boehmeriae]